MSKTFGLLCFSVGRQPWAPVSGAGAQVQPVLPEIHLNVWERNSPKKKSAFLDIGLMLDTREPANSIELVFPWPVTLGSVSDLSDQIAKPSAIPAIFNESWTVSQQQLDRIVSDPNKRKPDFAIVNTDTFVHEKKHSGHDALSIDIAGLKTKALNAAKHLNSDVTKFYLRMRIWDIERDFYCAGAGEPKDSWWTPSWQRTEVIDFRLNVRRGAPAGLEHAIGTFTEFSKVHLFLMRSREQDIVFWDDRFKAARSLEDENFWAEYSLKAPATKADIETNMSHVKQSLGYQWTDKASDVAPVREFGTLARFKLVEFGVGKFVVVALIMGAIGNAAWDGVKYLASRFQSDAPVQALCMNLPDPSVVLPRADCAPPVRTDAGKASRPATTSIKQDQAK